MGDTALDLGCISAGDIGGENGGACDIGVEDENVGDTGRDGRVCVEGQSG